MTSLLKAFIVGIIFPTVLVSFWVLHSYHQAVAYKKVTGHHVNVYDAMFLNLRVVNFPRVEAENIIVYEEDYDG